MRWINYGVEHHLVSESGESLARVTNIGCCWYVYVGQLSSLLRASGYGEARFSRVEDAKAIAERLVKAQHETV